MTALEKSFFFELYELGEISTYNVPNPWYFGVDPDPDPAIFVTDLKDAHKN